MAANTVLAKLGRAQAAMGAVAKSGENAHHHYAYANMGDYDKVIRPALEGEGLHLFESVTSLTPDERNPNRVFLELTMTIFDDTGESVTMSAVGEGIDAQDKAVYKATTGARKYLRALAFNLITTDDPEKDGGQSNDSKPAKPSDKQEPTGDAELDSILDV